MPGVIKITYVRCSGMGFVDFVTVQYLSHIVGSFVETVLTCQEVVLDKVCMGYLQFFVRSERNFAIQLLASDERELQGVAASSMARVTYGTCHLGLSQLLKINECARCGPHLLILHIH